MVENSTLTGIKDTQDLVKTKSIFLIVVVFLCLLPTILNIWSLDFSSPQLSDELQEILAENKSDVIITGSLQHALLEWSAIIIALCTTLLSFIYYKVRHDISVPILGLALLSAGFVDTFHILASLGFIHSPATSTDFIPFTWAFSRMFNSIILIISIFICLWIARHNLRSEYSYSHKNATKLLLTIIVGFALLAYLPVYFAAVSPTLPNTMFPEALISRPYDIVPLGLFALAGVLFWSLYRIKPSIAKFGLMLSIVPEIAVQLHMALGSSALYDNDFNIAHALKVVAYGTAMAGILLDLYHGKSANDAALALSHEFSQPIKSVVTKGSLEVGSATSPLGIKLPAAAFVVAMLISTIITFLFYIESERLLLQKDTHELEVQADLLTPKFLGLFEKSYLDVTYLGNAEAINAYTSAVDFNDNFMMENKRHEIIRVFNLLLSTEPLYDKIRFIGKAEQGKEIVSVIRSGNNVYTVPKSRLQSKEQRNYFAPSLAKNPGEVYFSKIELNREYGKVSVPHKAVLRASTPVYSKKTGEVFGIIVISINFDLFINQLKHESLQDNEIYLADKFGDFIAHIDNNKVFGFDLGQRFLIQEEFPELSKAISNEIDKFSYQSTVANESHFAAFFKRLEIAKFGQNDHYNLFLVRRNNDIQIVLDNFRTRSILLGTALAIIALIIAIFAAKRITSRLESFSRTLSNYHQTGVLGELPVKATDEIGVLARGFHNLIININRSLEREKTQAMMSKEISDKLSAVVNTAADAFITADSEGNILSFNNAAKRIFGYQEHEIIGKNLRVLMPPEDGINHDGYIKRYKQSGESKVIGLGREMYAVNKNGERFPIHLAISSVETSHGVIYTGIVRDQTFEKNMQAEQQAMQRALEKERTRLDEIIRGTNIGTWEWDLESGEIAINERYAELIGYRAADFTPLTIDTCFEICHPDDLEEGQKELEKVLTKQLDFFEYESRARCKNGDWLWVTDRGTVVEWDENGNPLRMSGTRMDISKQKSIERQISTMNDRMTLAADSAGIGIWQYDYIKQRLRWDDWMFKIYQVDKAWFKGNFDDWSSRVHPDDIERVTKEIESAISDNVHFDSEFRIILPNESIRYIKAYALAKKDSLGQPTTLIGVNYDITANKQAEQELIAAKELAEETAKLKSEFLASMSHEIRTPMNGVLGMLGLLLRDELTKTQRHRATLAQSSAQSLLTLINDILDFSKIEAGKLDLEILDFDVRSLLGDFAEAMAHKAQEKGLEVILDLSGIQYSRIKTDPGRLRQIMTNLVGNAIKFTESGEIVIQAAIKSKQGQEYLHCSVKDTGIGIPSDKIGRLFESFTQVDASTTRKYGGTGLGLAICKQLCELMQGGVDVSSELGKGSEFSFFIAVEKSETASHVIPTVDISGLPMLVVDDNETNREVLKQQLEIWGANVTLAHDGESALKILSQHEVNYFKVAFLDFQMPEMNGAMLGKEIRQQKKYNDLKLIMMTSIASRGDANYFSNIGFDAYFPKPTTTSDLFDALAIVLVGGDVLKNATPLVTTHYVNSLQRDTASNGKMPDSEIAHARILLVEDNQINQEVATAILAEFGVMVDVAADGVEAIDALNRARKDTPYQVIIMDCQMPEMDGYEATRHIRHGAAGAIYEHIPIIAMTANAMIGDKEKCLAAGMTDYLPKPIDPVALYQKLNQYINEKVEQKQLISAESETTATETNQLLQTIWDKEAALARVANKDKILHKLIALFIAEMPERIEAFNQAFDNEALDEVKSITHTIKGIAGNLSGLQLHSYAALLEQAIKDNAGLDKAKADFLAAYHSLYSLLEAQLPQSQEPSAETGVNRAGSATQALTLLSTLNEKLLSGDFVPNEELSAIEQQIPHTHVASFKHVKDLVESFEMEKAATAVKQLIIELGETP